MTWQELESEIDELAQKVREKPDIIIGIVRGGLVPARLLSSRLSVKDMYGLTVKKIEGERKVMDDINEDLSGKNVLLVEDMLETGKSLAVAKTYLESKGANVRTTALYTMPQTEVACDYSLKELQEVVSFPWE